MQCSRLFYPSAWLPRRAMHCGQKVTRLFDIENGDSASGPYFDFMQIFTKYVWSLRNKSPKDNSFIKIIVNYSPTEL